VPIDRELHDLVRAIARDRDERHAHHQGTPHAVQQTVPGGRAAGGSDKASSVNLGRGRRPSTGL
jgi:hypothetical protein